MLSLNDTYKNSFFVIAIACIAALGGFILGFDAGVIVDGKDQISSLFLLSNFQWSCVTCVSIFGSLITIPISGRFADKIGIKTMLLITAIGFMTGSILTATAYNIFQLTIGRFIVGICIGIAYFGAPLFISEIAPPHMRGSMVLLNGIAITAGQTLSFLAGYFLHDITPNSWRLILWIEAISATCFFLGMLLMPHSPRWIAKNKGIDNSRIVLTKIRGGHSPALEKELSEIEKNLLQHFSKSYLKDLFSKKIVSVLVLGVGLGVLQQFVGINAVMYYGPVIFETLGFNSIKNAIFATFCISFINLIFTIISAFLVDYVGRRTLLLSGTFITAISMFMLGGSYLVGLGEKAALFFMATYIIGYCISLGSLFLVIISEIYPLNIRGSAMSFVTALQFIANLSVTITFLSLFDFLGKAETFTLFGIMSCIAFLFVYLYVPETKGLTLEQIETNLNLGKKTRKLGEIL